MIPSFNVGRTQNIGSTALNLANPGIAASNSQLDALNKLAIARMNTGQAFAGMRNDLAQQGLKFEQEQSDPGILGLASLGFNIGNAINSRDYADKQRAFASLRGAGMYDPTLPIPGVQ